MTFDFGGPSNLVNMTFHKISNYFNFSYTLILKYLKYKDEILGKKKPKNLFVLLFTSQKRNDQLQSKIRHFFLKRAN